MTDERLNSVHLPAPRRETFRAARQALLGACGPATLAGSCQGLSQFMGDATAIRNVGDALPQEARFVLVDQDYVYPLKIGLNTVGRLPDNDVVIQDPYVSRRHCAILVHAGDGCELHDVASKNGTLLNGQPLQGPTRLTSGDQIVLCERRLQFLARDAAQQAPERNTLALE
jgi:pSer/pThr/pTyr-binding forkhead associated (FHA) protein